MDNANPTLTERRSSGSNNVNGSVRRGGGSGSGGPGGPGPHLHISAPLPGSNMARPISLMDTSGHNPSTGHGLQMAPTGVPFHIVRVIVNKVEGGYGMKVSGDNPVFVQSVKPGGAAEKAGLHAGDKIMEVNGENVVSSTHTEVVALIRASSQVILTVQKRTGGPPRIMGSPNPEPRPNSTLNPSNRITGPQPVDNEKQYQLHREKEQYYRLMIEREQRYVDTLRGDIAKSPDDKKCKELEKTESRIQMLQVMLNDHTRNSNDLQSMSLDKAESPPPPLPTTPPPKLLPPKLARPNNNGNYSMDDDNPPPLPKRNQSKDVDNNNGNKLSVDESTGRGRTSSLGRRHTTADGSNYTRMVDNVLYQHHVPGESASNPPPLPPRHPPLTCSQDPHLGDAANSINKQLSYPLVATCATIINNYPLASPNAQQPPTHQRTKSSPESLGAVMTATKAAADASMMLIASESMTNLSGYELPGTPPGTPPPPYPSPSPGRRCYSNRSSGGNGLLDGADGGVSTGDGSFEIINADALSPDISPLRCHWVRILDNSSLIHAANPQTTQEMIMSMEDEDISDQEVLQMEDHGSFKSLSKLWESTPHLAVFMNYILSNSDPNSLLFYLLTDLYKEGNTKEMRKWAYEIHSCFLVPGAPLPLCNVDEQIAREIDDVLQREYDKEEILRRIFWKARNLAKQELQRQLSAFQQKRTAGLSTIYGPPDALLTELRNDKAKELKMYETMLVNKLELYLKDLEEDTYDPQKYIMAAALTTVVTRVFGVRPPSQDLDRCPTFVNKEKSFRTKLGIRFSRKLNILGHHFVAQPYFTVIRCSNCLQIIYGISPQGYECSACHINLHRHCVKLYDDACPGPINNKKDRGMLNIIDRIKPEKQHRRKHSSNFLQRERDECVAQTEPGETKPGNPVSRSGSDRRPDAVREESQQQQQQQNQQAQSQLPSDQHNQHQRVNSSDLSYSNDVDPAAHPDSSTSLPPSSGNRERSGKSIGRTASLKEKQPDKKNQTKKPRNRSDPLTSRHDSDQPEFPLSPSGSSTGSSSNSLRVSSVSPSSSIDAGGGLHDIQHGCANDSDLEVGYELPDWSATIPQEKLAALTPEEKKRQELINEFFHTEQYHLRKLKILDKIFYGPLTHKKVFSDCDLNLIFANLPELVEIHTCFNSAMKAKRKENPLVGEVGDLIFNMFDSPRGEELQRAAASFCERQHLALELITERRRKDQRVEAALASCEKSHHCERQNLQSFMSAEMHRVTRYPILLERLIETTHKLHSERRKDGNAESQAEELERLRLALTRCKEIVNNVNETVRTASNRSKLQEIQNHLEILIEKQIESSGLRYEHNMFVTEYKNLDLTKYTLIREDKVELLRTGRNPINLQMLLLEEAVVFLVPENEKYTLKFIQSGIPANPFLAPIIKVSSFIVRLNAAGTTTMFLLNLRAESTQMYELKAKSRNDRDVWFKQLSDAAEAYNRREMGGRAARSRPEPISATPSAVVPITTTSTSGGSPCSATATITTDGGTDDTTTQDQTSSPTTHRNGVIAAERDGAASRLDDSGVALASATSDGAIKRRNNTMSMNSLYSNLPLDDVDEKRLSQPEMDTAPSHPSTVGGGVMVKLEADDWSLVQPSEVQVAVPPVHTAQPVLTPLEKIKRKDEEVRQALADKRVLVADLLSIPLQDYHHIADMVSVQSQKPAESEPTELILAAVHQVDILLNLMNESLNVSETDAVLATGGRHASCNSNTALVNQQQNSQNVHVPSVPVHRLQSIVPLLSTQLTNLLSLTKQGEEEKMTLRKELQRTRELLHVNNSVPEEYTFDHHHQEFCQSGDLERIDESPTETDTT